MKIFLSGDNTLNEELKKLFPGGDFCDVLDDSADVVFESVNFPAKEKLERISYIDERNSKKIPVLTSSLCVPVSEQASSSRYPGRLIGIGLFPGLSSAKQLEIAPSKITDVKILENAENILSAHGLNYSLVPDRVGLIFPRIISMIINEAAQVLSEDISSREDIDTAMKLGTNYPSGPLEWADMIGVDLVYNILASLHHYFGDNRYRPHFSLREMVTLSALGKKTGKGFYTYLKNNP